MVREIMTGRVLTVTPDMDTGAAAHLMGREQVRRLPVVENGRVCGMVSLGDLSQNEDSVYDAGDALSEITSNISDRDFSVTPSLQIKYETKLMLIMGRHIA